jgi:hypothetical protein
MMHAVIVGLTVPTIVYCGTMLLITLSYALIPEETPR